MWQDLSTEELSREYSPSSCAPDFEEVLRDYRLLSDAAFSTARADIIRYGEPEDERVFLFEKSASGDVPLLVFIHGGYWQELSARDSCFAAVPALAAEVSFAAIEYTLAPEATVARIVDQCTRAVEALCVAYRHKHPGARVVLAGSSAGAHLVAMLLAVDWHARGVTSPPLDGAVLLSGIYDLQPIVPTYINDKLGLSSDAAQRLSPRFLPLISPVPAIVCWGEHETREFARQSRDYAALLSTAGNLAACYPMAGRNHFDIVFDLCDPDKRIGRDTLALLRGHTIRSLE